MFINNKANLLLSKYNGIKPRTTAANIKSPNTSKMKTTLVHNE